MGNITASDIIVSVSDKDAAWLFKVFCKKTLGSTRLIWE
jgi:hypothetical protein